MLSDKDDNYLKLVDLMNSLNDQKCIIFTNTKLKVDDLVS